MGVRQHPAHPWFLRHCIHCCKYSCVHVHNYALYLDSCVEMSYSTVPKTVNGMAVEKKTKSDRCRRTAACLPPSCLLASPF